MNSFHPGVQRWEALSELVSQSEKNESEEGSEEGEGDDEKRSDGQVPDSPSKQPGQAIETDGDDEAPDATLSPRGRNKAGSAAHANGKDDNSDHIAAQAPQAHSEDEGEEAAATAMGVSVRCEAEIEAEELRQKKLMDDMVAATMELRNCIDFHDVFVDAEADAGIDAGVDPGDN